MKTTLKLFTLGWLIAAMSLAATRAQTSPGPAGETNPAAMATAASQAPDEATRKISELVHAGKYAEAQQLTAGLLVAYPEDQRLIKAKGMLEKILAGGSAVNAPANSHAPASDTTSDLSVANSNEEQLTGMEKVDYNALIELARQAQQNADLDQQKALLERFMDQSGPFLQKHPNQMVLWQLRAASALSLDDMFAGSDAGQKLLAAGAADSNNPNLEHLISQLKLKGWLDQEKMAEAKRNTADSLVNSLGMKFARMPGTTVVFSVWDTRVQDFQAFVNDTHYDATRDMSSGVTGHQGATFLASYVQAHYQRLGNSWQSPGWAQGPGDAVTGVSWQDAVAFCQWLTEKERRIGKIRPDQSYRLPSDAEWSMAVGLDEQKDGGRKGKSGKKTISPLGNDVPNAYGIYGLGGGFFQFTEDWYDNKMVSRTARGGSWFHSDDTFRRASFRMAVGPQLRFNDFSFRVVLSDQTQNQQPSSAAIKSAASASF